jgi:hypothetical protein
MRRERRVVNSQVDLRAETGTGTGAEGKKGGWSVVRWMSWRAA